MQLKRFQRGEYDIVIFLCFVAIFAVFAIWGLAIYSESKKPNYELPKHKWRCTIAQPKTVASFIQSNNTTIPVYSTVDVCIQYTYVGSTNEP